MPSINKIILKHSDSKQADLWITNSTIIITKCIWHITETLKTWLSEIPTFQNNTKVSNFEKSLVITELIYTSCGILNFGKCLTGSAQSLYDRTYSRLLEFINAITLFQQVITATAQVADQRALTHILAGLWHMAFVHKVPELLEDVVIGNEGSDQSFPVRGEQGRHTVGLRGPVQQCPRWVRVRFWQPWWVILKTVCQGEIEDKVLMIQY